MPLSAAAPWVESSLAEGKWLGGEVLTWKGGFNLVAVMDDLDRFGQSVENGAPALVP